MSKRVEVKRHDLPVRAPADWLELTIKADQLDALETMDQLLGILLEEPTMTEGLLAVLFEPHFDPKTLKTRKHPRLLLGGTVATQAAAALIRRRWTVSRAPKDARLDVDGFAKLRQVMLVDHRRIFALDRWIPWGRRESLAGAGFTVDDRSVLLVPMDLGGTRSLIRLAYDFGCIDVLAADKNEARGVVGLLRAELPDGADDPHAIRKAGERTATERASVVEVIDDPDLGQAEKARAYARRWERASDRTSRSRAKARANAANRPKGPPPHKTGPYGQHRRKKN